MRLHRLFACVATVGALLAAFLPQPALSTDVSFAFTLTANGQRLPNLPLIGDGSTVSACTIVVTSGSLFTLVPQWGPDGSAWHTATTVGGGSITATGSYGPGNIPLNDGGGHNTAFFGGVLSSFTAGTVKGTETCTNAVFPTPPPSPTPTPNPFTYPTTTPGGVLKANLTDAAGVSFTGASPVPVVGSIVAAIGVPTVIPSCPAASYPCGLPTPNANVQPSPIYTSPISGTVTNNCATNCTPNPNTTQIVHDPAPIFTGNQTVSGTVSNNCLSNCTPNPATPQFVHPDGTPFPISGSVTALISPSPFATFSPFPAGAVVLTGPSTAPAPSAGAYVVCVDSSGKLCVQTPAPYPTGAGGVLVASGTRGNSIILTSSSAHSCTSLAVGAFPMMVIDNVGAGTTVFPQFFDEPGSPTCAAADAIFGDGTTITLGPAQIITLFQGVKNGIAYSASGALSSNLVVGW